jgi:MFS family permease
MSESQRLRNLLRHPLLLPFYLPSLLFSFAQGVLAPVLPLYIADFQVSYGMIGMVLAGEELGTLLGDVPAGILMRHLGKRRSMLLGLGLAALSTAALFWAPSIPIVFGCRLLSGIGRAAYSVSRHAYIADATAVVGRGRTIAFLGGVFRLGGFSGPVIGGSVATSYGLRAPFLVFGGACLAAFAVVAIFVRIKEWESQDTVKRSPEYRPHLLKVLRQRRRILASAGSAQLFAQMVRAGRRVIIPLYGADVIGLNPQEIGMIISIAAGIDVVMFYPTGYIMDRFGRKFAIVPSFATQAVGMGLIPLTSSFVGLLFVTAVIGFGNGLGSGTMMTLGADLKPKGSQGEFLGLWRLIGDAGFVGAPLVVGAVADLVMLPAAALALSASGLTAALLFALLVPETLRRGGS